MERERLLQEISLAEEAVRLAVEAHRTPGTQAVMVAVYRWVLITSKAVRAIVSPDAP